MGVSIVGVWGLSEKIDELRIDTYTAMSCHDLRNNIVLQLKQGNQTYLDFQKDYYYHNCEVPLRDEVLKLQK